MKTKPQKLTEPEKSAAGTPLSRHFAAREAEIKARESDSAVADVRENLSTPGSLSDIVDRVRTAVSRKFSTEDRFAFTRDIQKARVVYELNDHLFLVKYKIDAAGEVSFTGESVEVRISYVPKGSTKESADPSDDAGTIEIAERELVVSLAEGALTPEGTAMAKIIEPGEGTSGLYTREVLERDGPKVFIEGLQMFWNHDTPEQETQRPEGDMDRLAGVLEANAAWQTNGPDGPGLYAPIRVTEKFRSPVNDLAQFTGLSVRGRARAEAREGHATPLITSLVAARSVDFVTKAGAGGRITSLFESVGRGEPLGDLTELIESESMGAKIAPTGDPINTLEEPKIMEKETREALDAILADNKQLRANQNRIDSRESVNTELDALAVTDKAIRGRVTKTVLESLPLTDTGQVKWDELPALVKERAEDEIGYLQSVQGVGARITDLGAARMKEAKTEPPTDVEMAEAFSTIGLTDEEAVLAVKG